MAKPTFVEIKDNIQAIDAVVWNQADQRPQTLDTFENDLAKAIAAAWSDVEDAFVISPVPVTGGASTPGGPLQNGVAILSPGMLINNVSFAATADKFSSSFPHGPTEGLLALVEAISLAIGEHFSLWVTGYSAALVASGGVCTWSIGPPPVPGTWSGGKIEDFALENGMSTGDPGMTADSLNEAIVNTVDPSILKKKQDKLQPALADFIEAVAKGFETTWNQWKSMTKISGGTGAGTASPPNGTVVGTVTSPQIE
jgi:hypothetical protein